tara:strand:+ start:430 stop:876 length:447 start_codon:yes stop_codon:yes gene_type:complete
VSQFRERIIQSHRKPEPYRHGSVRSSGLPSSDAILGTGQEGEIKRPFYDDPTLELLREKGNEHEKAYLEHLRSQGRSIKEFSDHGSTTDQALAAMRQGLEKVQKQAWVQLEGRRGKHPYHETIQPECIALTRAAIVVVGVGKAIRNLE